MVSSTYSTFCHVAPPSVVRKTPRSGLGPQTCPSAATTTTSGLVGLTTICEICPAFARPINFQLAPASGEKYTPLPVTTSLRGFASPVPTHTRFGLDGASAMAPIDAVGCFSNTAFHVAPPSVVFHTPPAAAPT